MKKVMASAGLLALGALGVKNAYAQVLPGAEKPWTLSATLRGFYDDNYTTTPNGPSSYGFELRPSGALNLTWQQTTLNLSYVMSMKYYEDRTKNNADWSHDFEVLLNHNFSERYSLDLADSFVIAQEPDLIDRDTSLQIRADGSNIRNTAALNFHAQLTPLFGVLMGYANTFYDYAQTGPDSFAAELNRWEHQVTLQTRWQLLPETVGLVEYHFGYVEHTSHYSLNASGKPFLDPSIRDSLSHIFDVGVEHTFSRNLSGIAKAGVQYTDFNNDPFVNSAWNPFVDLSMNYTYMDGGTLTLGFHNARNRTDQTGAIVGTGIATPQNITLDQQSQVLYGTVIQKITPKLTGTLTAQFQNSTYNGGGINNESDQFYLLGLNLSYQFTPFLSGEVGYNYDDLVSDVPGLHYTRNRVYIGVTGSY